MVMEPKYLKYKPETRFKPFCVNPCEAKYTVIDTKYAPARTISKELMSRARAVTLADELNSGKRKPRYTNT